MSYSVHDFLSGDVLLASQLNEMDAQIALNEEASSSVVSSGVLADDYSATKTYAVGDYCFYDGKLYRCTTAIIAAEGWNAEHWTEAELASDVTDLNQQISDVESALSQMGVVASKVSIPAPSGSTDLFTSADTSVGEKFSYKILTGTGTPYGYNAYIELQDSNGNRLAIYGKTTIGTTATEYSGDFAIPDGFAKAVLRGTCAGAYLDYLLNSTHPELLKEEVDSLGSVVNPWFSESVLNEFYTIADTRKTSSTSTNMTEFRLTTGTNGVPLAAGHKYLAYYEIEIGDQIGTWPAATSFVPFLRNNSGPSNIDLTDAHTETIGSYQVGDKRTIYGFYTPSSPLTSVAGWMVTYNGGTSTRVADWLLNKVYLVDVTGLSDYNDLLSRLSEISGTKQYVYNSKIEQMDDDISKLESYHPPVNADLICWGDSLTAGAGGEGVSYPQVCASELGISFLNCGVGGENCQTIAARQGGNNVVIPAGSVNGTYQTLTDIFGNELAPLLQGNGNGSGNKLIIEGHECTLSYASGTGYTIGGYTGDALSVPTLARFAGSDFTGKVVAIWIGTNGGAYPGLNTGLDVRIAWANSMIAHIGHNNYVVLGLIVGEETASFYINEENKMRQAFGNKYFPTRKYLIESGLTIAGITPTPQDETDIADGKVPTSLKAPDGVHLNAAGYTSVGKLLANKIRSLGYV